MVEHALGSLGLPGVLAEVDEGNATSVAVVRQLGMTAFAVVPGALSSITATARRPEPRNQLAPFPGALPALPRRTPPSHSKRSFLCSRFLP